MSELDGEFAYVAKPSGWRLRSRYKVETSINAEGQAVVCFATDEHNEEKLAIKRHTDMFGDLKKAANAYREFILTESVSHDNIQEIFDVYTPANTIDDFDAVGDFYMVASLSKGTLDELIRAQGAFNLHRAWMVMEQLLDALVYLHEHDIIHRDLHTSNIVVDEDYGIKIIDFGLSTEDTSGEASDLKLTSLVTAQPYRAPEVIREEEYTKSVDVWAAGCIFYELLKGECLFDGLTEDDVLDQQEDRFGTVYQADQIKKAVELLLPDECFEPAYDEETLKLAALWGVWCSNGRLEVPECECESRIRAAYAEAKEELPQVFANLFERSPAREKRGDEERPWKNFAHFMTAERIAEINLKNARDLFGKMMSTNPASRISAEDALRHVFVNGTHIPEFFVPQKLPYTLGDAPITKVKVWKELLYDHLKRPGSTYDYPGRSSRNAIVPPISQWIPSFQTSCEDCEGRDEHVLSYTCYAFRPFNEEKLVVRVLLADYRKAVEEIKKPTYETFSPHDRYAKYIDLIYSTDDHFEERYQKYARAIQRLVNHNDDLSLLILDDSDLRLLERVDDEEHADLRDEHLRKFASRLHSFAACLKKADVPEYEMQFTKLTIRYDLQRSKIKEFLDPLLTAMREVAKLPSSLELVLIEDVKSKCRNHATLAEAERDYREFGGWVFSTDFTMVVCPTNTLSKEEIQCKEGKDALLAQLVASTSSAR